MNILMTTDTVGGVWTYALDLAEALGKAGTQVTLATMGDPPGAFQQQQLAELRLPCHVGRYKLEWMDDPWKDVAEAGAWLLDLERAVAPDVVHLNGYCHAALPWRAPVLVAAHSCVWTWFQAVQGQAPPPGPWNTYYARVQEGLHAAGRVVAPTAAYLAAVQSTYGQLPRTRAIHNGRSVRSGLRAPARKQKLILAAGRLWDDAKNVAAVEAIASELAWPVQVAGPGRAAPVSAVGHAGQGGQPAQLLGPLEPEALAARMREAAIFVSPARYEPFGLCALEAALCGCALVLGDIATLHEVWGDAAVYVDPDDSQALRRTLGGLIEDTRRREALAEAAVRRAERYTAEAMAAAYLEEYRSMGAPSAASRAMRPAATPAHPMTTTPPPLRATSSGSR